MTSAPERRRRLSAAQRRDDERPGVLTTVLSSFEGGIGDWGT